MFYIMRAYHLSETPRKLNLAGVARAQGPCTMILATRHYGWNKTAECAITGCAGNYGVKPGDRSTYTIDTGLGHRNRNSQLDIEHVLQINEAGLVTSMDGVDFPEPVEMPAFPNRHTWVMK